jgi:septal ring factor EnvC (AmiA/AmiB activator)
MKNETKIKLKKIGVSFGILFAAIAALFVCRQNSGRRRIRAVDNTIGKLKKGIDSSTRQLDKIKSGINSSTETNRKLGSNIENAIESTNNALKLLEDIKKRNDN